MRYYFPTIRAHAWIPEHRIYITLCSGLISLDDKQLFLELTNYNITIKVSFSHQDPEYYNLQGHSSFYACICIS